MRDLRLIKGFAATFSYHFCSVLIGFWKNDGKLLTTYTCYEISWS